MWTAKNRGRYDRSKLRYPSDLTDDEWVHVEPLIPSAKRGGNRRHVDVREVMNGIMYVLSTGCQWRAIPKDLPARSTLFDYLDLWSWDGTLDRIHHALYVECREQGEAFYVGPCPKVAFHVTQYGALILRNRANCVTKHGRFFQTGLVAEFFSGPHKATPALWIFPHKPLRPFAIAFLLLNSRTQQKYDFVK